MTVDERAAFLARFEPFASLPHEELERVASLVAERRVAAGEDVLVEDGPPARALYLIRSGSMELLHDGEVADVLAPGESFGHPSLLSGLSPAFTVRGHAPSVLYEIPGAVALEVLGRPAGARFVATTLRERLIHTGDVAHALPSLAAVPVASVARAPVFCDAEATLREVAREMTAHGVDAVLVRGPEGLGIVTDRHLRERVVAGRVDADAPASTVATPLALTVAERALALDAMLDMLEAGVHHLPVVDARGVVTAFVSADDLMSVESRSPFALRRDLAHARDVDALAEAARGLRALFVVLLDAGFGPADIGRVLALQSDAATTRLVDLALEEHGQPPRSWAWLALGSVARREVTLASDQDNALAYEGGEADPEAEAYFGRLAAFVNDGLERCGFGVDPAETVASAPRWRMSRGEWERVFQECLGFPNRSHLVRAAIAFDFRHVGGGLDVVTPLDRILRRARDHPDFLAVLARNAIDYRPPLRFRGHLRGRGRTIDLKLGAAVPITNLARFHALSNGITVSATLDRLAAVEEVGALDRPTAQALGEAFTIVSRLRLEHHRACLTAGTEPDNVVDPRDLPPLARAELRESLRATAAAQKRLSLYAPFLGR